MAIGNIFESGEQKQHKGHLANLIKIALVDGKVDDAELALIRKIAKKLSITDEECQQIIENPTTYYTTPPSDKEERAERFYRLIKMVFADGIVDDSEVKLVDRYAVAIGYPTDKSTQITTAVIEASKEELSLEKVEETIDSIL